MASWPDMEPRPVDNAIPIARRSGVHPEEVLRDHLIARGEGVPLVVTDATDGWKARRLWSVDYFAQKFGDDELICSDKAPLRHVEEGAAMQTYRVPLRDFVNYMKQPNHFLAQREQGAPFYGNSWSPFFKHETMRKHVKRMYFVPDMLPDEGAEEEVLFSRQMTKVFFGPPNTITRLHYDTFSLHAWLSQIKGRKQFILYPPSQAYLIHAGEGGLEKSQTWFDPTAPDYNRFPRARKATAYVAVCDEGDTLLVPSNWFHYAVSLTPSITMMKNFFNQVNEQLFMGEWNERQAAKERQRAEQEAAESQTLTLPADVAAKYKHAEGCIPSATFAGAKEGYVFTAGAAGVGYYPDVNGTAVRGRTVDITPWEKDAASDPQPDSQPDSQPNPAGSSAAAEPGAPHRSHRVPARALSCHRQGGRQQCQVSCEVQHWHGFKRAEPTDASPSAF